MKILIIGASGHVGRAAASALDGHEIVAASRNGQPSVDVTDPRSIERLFEQVGDVDAVVAAVGSVPFAPLSELGRDDYEAALRGKVLSQLDVVRIGTRFVRDGGSFTLTSGILAREPIATGAAASLANGALEAFVLGAAPELPRGIRINAVSPSVLEDAPSYHSSFPGFVPVSSYRVGMAYAKSVLGVQTGEVLPVD
ncbi:MULTISPECIES: short chain dehydrogenase [unclassified Microbacterium]|uniref:short chain dehydrogenase n=1 Tax=unclassified Microbacterium TaxID=2609290 RepID=UPI001604B8C4|nr:MULTISPECIES: short chain dehydrogenase [unclassified Microbacterium]QNA93285.1 short chain dehydrogenase [Microbacterium sp. Se63.02b]QYM63496.1 short chain dehydrogenase [Microbacterium sp. Se5.02b]